MNLRNATSQVLLLSDPKLRNSLRVAQDGLSELDQVFERAKYAVLSEVILIPTDMIATPVARDLQYPREPTSST